MDECSKKGIYFPENTWKLIKSYLIIKIHPVAKLIKMYTTIYTKPSIFMTRYVKQRNGGYKFSINNKLDISNSPEEFIDNFFFYLRCKKILMRYCKSCRRMSSVFVVNSSPYLSMDCIECCSKPISISSYLEY